VSNLFATRLPATLTVMVPILCSMCCWHCRWPWGGLSRGSLTDRVLMVVTTVALSISFLVYHHRRQYLFGFQLGWFPVQGWSDSTLDQPGHLHAAAGAAGGAGGRVAADAAVPQLLPRRDRPGLCAHRARQGPDRAHRAVASTCCATR
jgi:ABC-type dipeptide/oligopeptide/nickel transport system permease component